MKKKSYLFFVFIILSVIICGISISIIYSYSHMIVREYDIISKAGEDEGKGDPVCIVALSDLHGRMIGEGQSKLVAKVKAQSPDLIFLLGDMINRVSEEDCDSLLILTRKLCRIAPVYWVEGNHEAGLPAARARLSQYRLALYDRMKKEMADEGAVLLSQNYRTVTIRGKTVNLCGILTHYYWGEEEAGIMEDFKKLPGIKVLLCHYPESLIWYKAFEGGGLDLALCGHTHGGLVRVPFKGGLYAPEWGWWPIFDLGAFPIYDDTSWGNYGGADHKKALGTMIISAGLAGMRWKPRVNNPMEVTVVHVY